jgi:nucleoside-diphosphate-sugar epimerase
MHCLVTGAAGFVGSCSGQHLLINGHEMDGIDVCIGDALQQVNRQNVSMVHPQGCFTFIFDGVGAGVQAIASEKVAGEVVNIVEGSCVSRYEAIQMLQAVSGMPVKIVCQEKRHSDVDYAYTDTSCFYTIPGYNARVSLSEGLAREFADMAELYGYSKDIQAYVA